jgi:hypothetical protein
VHEVRCSYNVPVLTTGMKKIKKKVESYDAPPLYKSKTVLKDTISFQKTGKIVNKNS